jgi:uncharacterized protein
VATNANHILDEKFVPHEVEGSIEIDEFIVGDEAFEVRAPASYAVTCTALEDGIIAQGEVSMPVRASCSRCLEPFETTICSPVDTMFYYEPTNDEDGDPYPIVDEYGHIDLEAELIEDLIVAAPFAPLHDEGCRGLCPVCGVNRNDTTCSCAEDTVDERYPFAGLDELLALSSRSDEDLSVEGEDVR